MASLIARILSRSPSNHARAVHVANHQADEAHPRLSYADLDRLLDQEERLLAHDSGHKAGHDDIRDEKLQTDENLDEAPRTEAEEQQDEEELETRTGADDTEHPPEQQEQHQEEATKEVTDQQKAEEKDQVVLKEQALDDLHTISAAEDHLMKDKADLIYEWATVEQIERMKKLLLINCLHRGDLDNVSGKRWMVAIDGSAASRRAWHKVLKLIGPLDHLLVVTARDKNLPKSLSMNKNEAIQLRFELWMSARHIVKPFMEELAKTMDPSRYSVMIPEAWDARRLICNLAKRYGIDVICVGEHSREEHKFNHWHLRSLPSFIGKNAPCRVLIY